MTPICPECGAEEPDWHAPRKFDLERLLKAIMAVTDRHIEMKVQGHAYMDLPIMPLELKELRSAIEPFRSAHG